MPSPPVPRTRRRLVAVIGVSAAALLTPFVSQWESGGKPRLTAYRDLVGVWTICNGVTDGVRPGTVETAAGCAAREEAALVRHADPVLACTPVLRDHPAQLAAAVSLAYNIGTNGYCASTVARRFTARDWRGACDAFLLWNRAGGRVVPGLDRRRHAERDLCLKDLAR